MKNLKSILTLISLSILLFACESLVDGEKNTLLEESAISDTELRAPAPGNQTIAEIVVAAATNEDEPQFTLLLAALEYTGLTGVFTGGGQYTVFAPTDEAFVNLVVELGLEDVSVEDVFGVIDTLLGEGTVANVLLYHVAEGRRAANSVVPRNARQDRKIQTLLGVDFSVNSNLGIIADGNAANIVAADISASNGIIHVIDAVILPIEL